MTQLTLDAFIRGHAQQHVPLDTQKKRQRKRPKNSRLNTCSGSVCRLAALNVGGRLGWRRGASMTLEWLDVDIMFLLDTKNRSTVRGEITRVIAEVWDNMSASSSMIVLARDPARWKVVKQDAGRWGCYIRITDGYHRVQGIYLRPTDKVTPEMTTIMQQMLLWLAPAGLALGDWNARHEDWDKITKPRGKLIKRLAQSKGLRILAPCKPTFVTSKGSSTVDFAVVKNWTANCITKKIPEFMAADHSIIIVEGSRSDKPFIHKEAPRYPRTYKMDDASIADRERKWIARTISLQKGKHFDTYQVWKSWISSLWQRKTRPLKAGWTFECEKARQDWKTKQQRFMKTGLITDMIERDQAARLKRQIISKTKKRIKQQSLLFLANSGPAGSSRALARLLATSEKFVPAVDPGEWLKVLIQKSGQLQEPRQPLQPFMHHDQNWEPIIADAIQCIKTNKATGIDGIPAELIKSQQAIVVSVFQQTIVDILETGRLPEEWRTIKLTMVPKNDPNSVNPTDFRPIALMSQPRKLVERCIAMKINEKLCLHRCQHGFRRGTGIEWPVALLDAQLKHSRKYVALCLDMTGAFDTANLETIKKKLLELQLDPEVQQLALIFLNESACMVVDGHHFWTERGVAQGSVLGPLFWILFIDDLATKLAQVLEEKSGRPYPVLIYADDVAILLDAMDLEEIQAVEKVLNEWACATKVKWNAAKSCLVLSQSRQSTIQIRLHGNQVGYADATKYLGFMINEYGLDIEKHISYRLEKARKRLKFMQMRKLTSPHLSIAAVTIAYKALVRPILEFGLGIMEGIPEDIAGELEKVQDECLSALTTVHARKSKSINILLRLGPIRERYQEKCWRLRHALWKQDNKILHDVRDALGELNYHIHRPLDADVTVLMESKAALVKSRVDRWKLQLVGWRSQPPWCLGMPPMLKESDGVSARWVLKWYLGLGLYGEARKIVGMTLLGGIDVLRNELSRDSLTEVERQEISKKILYIRGVFKMAAPKKQTRKKK